VLDEALWPDAGIEQEKRRTKDPWEDALANIPVWHKEIKGYDAAGAPIERTVLIIHADDGLKKEIASAADLMKHVLDIPVAHQTPATSMRLSTVMRQLGWERNSNGYVYIKGQRVKGFFRLAPDTRAPRF
jgi:hypothetical protein